MSYLSNFTLTDRGIELAHCSFALVKELARQAYFLCKADSHDPEISELEELVEFTLDELHRAGEHGAKWFLASIKDKSIADNDYTRKFCTAEGYIEREGEVNVLINWACSIRDAAPAWGRSPLYVRALNQRHYPRLMTGSFALYKLNSMIGINGQSGTVRLESVMEELSVVVDAVSGGSYNHGWADCEQLAEESKRENGKAGAKVRNEKYSQTRTWVIEKYVAGNWPSPRAASFELAPGAIEFSKQLGKPLSAQRAQTTVYEWLLAENNSRHAQPNGTGERLDT